MDRQLADRLYGLQATILGKVDEEIGNVALFMDLAQRQAGQFRTTATIQGQHERQPIPSIMDDLETGMQASINPCRARPDWCRQ